jgi:hypothetical protein
MGKGGGGREIKYLHIALEPSINCSSHFSKIKQFFKTRAKVTTPTTDFIL